MLGERRAHCKYSDFLPWAVQERLNWSICRLDCWLWWDKESKSSIVFARWSECANMGRHIGATWRIRWNRPPKATMQITLTTLLLLKLIDWAKVLRSTRHKISHFGDVLPSQSLGIVLNKLNLTQQKHKYTNKLQHKIIQKVEANTDKLQHTI